MIVYLNLQSTDNQIKNAETFLKGLFESVVFNEEVIAFYCREAKKSQREIKKLFRQNRDIQSYSGRA